MKLLIILLTLCGLCFGQYTEEVSSYTIYWNKLDAGQSPIITDTFHSDTVITMLWERGDEVGPGYISPYTGEIALATVVVNTETIWTDNTAGVSRDIILDNGTYEVTIQENDMYNNSSGHSDPLFIQVAKSVARIQINLRLR